MDKNKWLKTGILITVVIFLILISSAILKHATIHQVYSYYDLKDESESHHSVSFTDIKAQKN